MKKLTKAQVVMLQNELIGEHGGSPGLRDENLLDSALAAPFQTFDGQSLLPTIQQKAARLGFGLIKNHPFVDGNKRIGAHITLTVLAINGIELEYDQKELYEVIVHIASGETTFNDFVCWILNHEIAANP